MKIDGRCHCGAVAFEAEIDPNTVGICHCTDCQALTGSAYRVTVRARADNFALRGQVTTYLKIADSGTRRSHAFCPVCGTPIYACAPDQPTAYSLRLGTITQRAALAPARQQWCRSALPWALDLGGVPRHEGQG